jgi:hypothetical protein
MALDIVINPTADIFFTEEYHKPIMDSFKFHLEKNFSNSYKTINREVVIFDYHPETQKFELIEVKPMYKYPIEITIERCKRLKEQMKGNT